MVHCLVWLLTVVLYTPVFLELYSSRWSASDYTHAYFILPISLWLVWRKRAILNEVFSKNTCGNISGLSILLFGFFLFLLGWRWDFTFIVTLSIIPILYGLVSYLYGSAITKQLLFPILYLLLLVPIPVGVIDNITLPMRYGNSVATEVVLKLFHYPVGRKGLLLYIGDSVLFMGEPCSGFRSLITLFSLGLVYVYTARGSMLTKGILVFSIIPIALTGNFIRVLAICLITYYFGTEAGQGFFHKFSGILVFVITALGLAVFESVLNGQHNRKRKSNTNKEFESQGLSE